MVHSIPFDAVQRLISACVSAAEQQSLEVAVAVVDSGGHLLAFARMDGVSTIAVDVTRRKARTACYLRLPTHALAMIASSDPVVGADLNKNPEICLVAGGLPIMHDGQCVGGVGVSGGRSEQDRAIAELALQAL